MRIRHMNRTAITATLLVSCLAVASAQTAPPPLDIERVPLINVQINNKEAPATKATAPGRTTTTSSTTKAPPKAGTRQDTTKAATSGGTTATSTITNIPADASTGSTTTTSDSSGNITNITTHNNNVTYNITNNVNGVDVDNKHAPAIMLNVNPDLQPEITPLITPVIVIQPPPPPAPAAESTDPIDDDAIEAENALPDDDIDNIDDLDNLADPTAELGMEVDEEIVAPESLPAVPTPQAAPAVAAPVTAAPAPAPTPAPAAATASVPTVPTVPAAPVIPVEPATPAATSSTIPVPPAPVITPAAPNTPVSAAPVSHILVRQAQAPTTPQKPKDKIKQPRPTKPKKTIQTKIKDANTPSLIRTINRDIGKNIIRTSITTRAGASKTLTLAQAPANPGPPRVAPEHQPAPYGLWIKSNIGSGKKPTIIALHGCGGLYSTIAGERSELTPRHETMIRVFTSAGYNVFLPDSFTPRGKHGNCTEPLSSWAKSSQNDRIDVEAAIQWLSGRDDVDMKRIALFGWSYGATTMFASLNLAYTDVAIRDFQPRAAIGFYPNCTAYLNAKEPFKLAAPALILIGENDTWTPAKPCKRFEKRVSGSENTITLRTYPDTYHDFDAPGTPIYVRLDVNSADGKPGGITAGGNSESRAAAYKEILLFLQNNM